MSIQPMDALQCFTSISDSVPSWITRVTKLADHTSKKHAEFSEGFKRLAQAGEEQYPRRRKNSSIHSIRPESDLKAEKSFTPSFASDEENPLVRVRQPLVIYYDDYTQKELEQTVRDIGSARNSLRKGKMSQMLRKPSLGMLSDRSREALRTMQLPPGSFRRTRTPTRPDQKETAFECTDNQLDIAQSLCESAAHKFLRRGDCQKELSDILAKFEGVLQTASQEAYRLRAEQEREAEEQPANGTILLMEQKFPLAAFRPIGALEDGKPLEPGAATIEVDDTASDSSISIDIPAFRTSRTSRFRV